MRTRAIILLSILFLAISCNDINPVYPDEPVIDYQEFKLYIIVDALGNNTLVGKLSFDFTDGDGNLGLPAVDDPSDLDVPDTVKYNFFLHLHDLQGFEWVEIPEEDGGVLKYRIPLLNKNPLSGTLDLDIAYPVIKYDTIYYTFYIYDRDFNRSNVDTTDIIKLSGIDLEAL